MSGDSVISSTRPETVCAMFARIAERYDRTNAWLSLGLHSRWNRVLGKTVLQRGASRILDLCCGTGAIAQQCLRQVRGRTLQITCADFCPSMLGHATAKLSSWAKQGHQLQYLCVDAQELPLAEESFDAVTIAYGIRNIADPAKALREAARVLRGGGQLAILELTRPQGWWMKPLHRFYLRCAVPLLGALLTRQKDAYAYLASSIQAFCDPAELREILERAGFEKVESRPLLGGVCTLLTAQRLGSQKQELRELPAGKVPEAPY